ncbi:MAG: RnfABCDGE type electron transport complex subunit D [Gammaproteobacteria bacterium]|nr:RnfABCDGE type electron transport complex subunit D [Gammaproteobacteria bacterium]
MEKFLVSKGPYLRSADENKRTTSKIMLDVCIALLPVILLTIYKNVIKVFISGTYTSVYQALYPLLLIIIGPIFSILLELLCLFIIHKEEINNFKDLINIEKTEFGGLPGLFFVLTCPPYTPLWIVLIGIAVGEVVGKMLFGGFGQNIFNPALVGRAFIAFTFSNYLGASYLSPLEASIDAYAGATPLTFYSKLDIANITYDNMVSPYGGLLNFFLGMTPGALGETSALAILIGGIYLAIKRVIDYRIPLVYIGVVFITTFFIGLKVDGGIWYPTYMILSGGLFFGAFFMATEPVTSPKTPLARVIFAAFLGVLTVLFRIIGNMPEGVATAIVTMNIFGLAINQYVIKLRISGKLEKRFIPGMVVMIVLFITLFTYTIVFALN